MGNHMTKPLAKAENAPKWAADLTLRERLFVESYLIDLNGKAAAIRAGLGHNPKSAVEIASRFKKRAHVAAAISALMAERNGVTAVSVVDEIGKIAFAKFSDFARVVDGTLVVTDTAQLTEEQQACIAEISETIGEHGRTIRIKLHPKLDALDKLAKVLSLYKERSEVAHHHEVEVVDPLDRINRRLDQLRTAMKAGVIAEIDPPVQRIAPAVESTPPLVIDAE
jgi:phage terminase small subunit